ncbi:hypothetical protein ALC57_02491, partial [Trachymyrmex cornetzi]
VFSVSRSILGMLTFREPCNPLHHFHNGGYRGQNTVSSFVAGTVLPREEAARGDRVSSSLQTFIPDRARVTGAHDRTNPVTTDDRFGCPRTRTARNCPADLGTERQMLLVCQSSGLTCLLIGAYRLSSNATRKVNDTRYMGGRCNPNAQHPGCPQRAIGTSRAAVSWACLAAAECVFLCVCVCVLRPHINGQLAATTTAVFEPRTDVAIIDRGRFHCDDLLSAAGAGRCSPFYRGCYYCVMPSAVPPPLRESPDLERETAARFSRHILSAVRRRALRSVQREKNVESCGFHYGEPLSLPEKVDYYRNFRDEIK